MHRRILFSMYDTGIRPGTPFRKSARVVGDVMGWFHPHGGEGDLRRHGEARPGLRQPLPLVEPQGNFGTVDDPPAAMRYTEARLEKLAMHLLDGLDEDTVDFQDNYSGSARSRRCFPPGSPISW